MLLLALLLLLLLALCLLLTLVLTPFSTAQPHKGNEDDVARKQKQHEVHYIFPYLVDGVVVLLSLDDDVPHVENKNVFIFSFLRTVIADHI